MFIKGLFVGLALIPAILGIMVIVLWCIDYFKYLRKVLSFHYDTKFDAKMIAKLNLGDEFIGSIDNDEAPQTDEAVESTIENTEEAETTQVETKE